MLGFKRQHMDQAVELTPGWRHYLEDMEAPTKVEEMPEAFRNQPNYLRFDDEDCPIKEDSEMKGMVYEYDSFEMAGRTFSEDKEAISKALLRYVELEAP